MFVRGGGILLCSVASLRWFLSRGISIMSKMVLVRHGQASFFSDDYDKLSEMGVRQSAVLGEYWLERDESFDEVYVGTLRRQRETADAAREVFEAAGRPWPEPVVLPGLDEYPADEVMDSLVPVLSEKDESFARLKSDFDTAQEGREKYRTFHRLLAAVMVEWVGGRHDTNGLMPWTTFRDGVRESIRHIVSRAGSGRRVVVFSSGGPIGVAVQSTLRAPDLMAAELNWRIHNCSVTELTFSGDRIALDCFNVVAHLTDPEMLTYR